MIVQLLTMKYSWLLLKVSANENVDSEIISEVCTRRFCVVDRKENVFLEDDDVKRRFWGEPSGAKCLDLALSQI